jgi:hypothetical protein
MYYQRAEFCCAYFLWAEGLNANDINEEMFPVYGGGTVSHVIRFTTGSRNCHLGGNVSLMTKRLKRRCGSG